jgi:hypothetical protein
VTHPIVARLFALDDALAQHGFPRLSPWWRETFENFYESGRRQLVLRVGRRGGKSSSLVRAATCEALFGEHVITPGDVGIVGVVSVSRDEAAQRLRLVKAILDVLSVRYRPIEGGIELEQRPIAFKVYAATVAAVVGGTWICGICDEVARWKDADTGANPATMVLASLRPTMATQPNAKLFLSSSPLGTEDAHADAFKVGDTAWQEVAFAPTWLANPTITEAETHALERDDEVWRREYAAVPIQGSVLSIFSETLLSKATRKGPAVLEPESGRSYCAAMDPATRGNAWTLAIATEDSTEDGSGITRIVYVREWRGRKSAPLDPDVTLAEIASELRAYGLSEVWSDQFAGDFVVSIAEKHDLTVQIEPATAASKVAMYEGMRQRFADGAIELPADDQLRSDLLGVNKLVQRNGLSIELTKTPDGRHCDLASAAALAVTKCAGDSAMPYAVRAFESGRKKGFFAEFGYLGAGPSVPVEKTTAWDPREKIYPGFERAKWGDPGDAPAPESSVTIEIGGWCRAFGHAPKFTDAMVAEWGGRDGEPTYTAACTPEFKVELAAKRRALAV